MEISEQAGKWLGWIGIIVGVIGFFWQPVWMGIIAIVLGVIGLFSEQKTLNWAAIIVGAVVLIYHFFIK
ncbi:C4-dicarboxylate ABC transporter [Fundicoccus culcitae]|uniref:Protein Asterix n=1 Tax=Fundicoccus culcitae TaxID=2969821 RepID=A0ABY5P4N0_9LACT|nr:C4-dicarboxylate ABC transporter [Fundicoccus culcitae]UUX33698.1 protein Asterix [Fundicoccus culcitae]